MILSNRAGWTGKKAASACGIFLHTRKNYVCCFRSQAWVIMPMALSSVLSGR